jgi:potassium/chloride transporter 4/5/6
LFTDTLHNASANQLATLIPKGIEQFPENNEKREGTIDIWWIVRILYSSNIKIED